ncbi:MAG: T9SS type A sorting domain-containing protein [Cyclobacteriaceae bacterium]|nr:T9SS type A sorting domain-containing protein [Cyclobacteriaceae bacterium HetDA_MAG_MS6]
MNPLLSSSQCQTETVLENTSTKTIPSDGTCDSPADDNLVCDLTTADTFDFDGTLTVLSCATLNLTASDAIWSYGNIVVQEGATLTSNRTLRVRSGSSVTINGTLDIGDGTGNDNLVVVQGSTVTVGTSGSLNVGNGNVRLGSTNGANAGTLTLDGSMTVSGDVDVNGQGTLEGSGQATYGGTFTTTGGGTVTESFTDCSSGSSNSSCGDPLLPVELLSFAGVESPSNTVSLNWSTATEINNSGFHIEKSKDGIDFQPIGFVEGHGNTEAVVAYQFVDTDFYQSSYYRLLQVDFDGASEYSSVIYVDKNKSAEVKIVVAPNPVSSFFRFRGSFTNAQYTIVLMDLLGSIILSQDDLSVLEVERLLNNQLPTMQQGSYLLRFTNATDSFTVRFLKR